MKPAPFPSKKLFQTALYTSPLIAILAITPLTFRLVSIYTSLATATVLTIFIFIVWITNITLTWQARKYPFNNYFKYSTYIISFLVAITLAVYVRNFIKSIGPERDLSRSYIDPAQLSRARFFGSLVLGFSLNVVVIIIQNLILLREKQVVIELENAQLKIKNVEATNQQLKQQIHPHFLFNSLNTLKLLIKKKPAIAEEYLIKLSDFLRSSLAFNNNNKVKVGEELKLCLDYLEMQKMRFNEALQYTVDIPDNRIQTGFLPAFSLQLLAENAIKHNAATNELPLRITITYLEKRIIVLNNIQKKHIAEHTSGIGLINLSERYKILSGDELIIHSTEQLFSVSIKVLDNENSDYRG